MLVRDLHVRVINAATGELLRVLTLNPSRDYQPTGRPPRPPPGTPRKARTPNPDHGFGVIPDVLRHHMARSEGLEPPTF